MWDTGGLVSLGDAKCHYISGSKTDGKVSLGSLPQWDTSFLFKQIVI